MQFLSLLPPLTPPPLHPSKKGKENVSLENALIQKNTFCLISSSKNLSAGAKYIFDSAYIA